MDLTISLINDGEPTGGSERLFGLTYFPICTPAVADAYSVKKPADLQRATLIEVGTARDAWSAWFRVAEVPELMSKPMIMIEDFGAYLDAVVQGLGIGLGSPELTGESLRSGQVIKLFDITCPYPSGVYLKAGEGVLEKPLVRSFYNWLLDHTQRGGLSKTSELSCTLPLRSVS